MKPRAKPGSWFNTNPAWMGSDMRKLAGGWFKREGPTARHKGLGYKVVWWKVYIKTLDGADTAFIVCFNAEPHLFYIRPLLPPTNWNAVSGPDEHTFGPYNDLATAKAMYVILYGNE